MRRIWWTCAVALVVVACDCGDDPMMPGGDAGQDAGPDGDPGFECESGVVPQAYVIEAGADGAPYPDGIGGVGDLVLDNGVIRAVISAVDRPAHLGASGGTLIDLYAIGESDHWNELSQLGGPAQELRVVYEGEPEVVETADAFRASITVRGRVEPEPGFAGIAPEVGRALSMETTYELRCDQRVIHLASTLSNGSDETATLMPGTAEPDLMPMDLLLWGGGSIRPFCPYVGSTDGCPEIDLSRGLDPLTIVFTKYVAGLGSLTGSTGSFAYFVEEPSVDGMLSVHNDDFSTVGPDLGTRLDAGESKSFRRAIAVGDGADAASATDIALDALAAAGELEVATVTGRVVPPDGAFSDDSRERPMVWLIAAPSTPITAVRVEPDGSFRARVTPGSIRAQVRHPPAARVDGPVMTVTAGDEVDLGELTLAPLAELSVEVLDDASGLGLPARVIVLGEGGTESPELGPGGGGSPAQNVALTDGDGLVTVRVPHGSYRVIATHGPSFSIAQSAPLALDDAGASVTLRIRDLDVIPDGYLTADFHVHSAASFDSSLPPEDRVLAYIAEGVDAIVSTEHDVLYDYAPALATVEESLSPTWQGRLRTFVGIEATSFVPWERFPTTIGHHNAFPLTVQEGQWKNGAPVDEYLTPAGLYDALRALPAPLSGGRATITQMNHPRGDSFGSVESGYFTACGLDPSDTLAATDPCFADLGALDAIEVTNGDASEWIASQRDFFAMLQWSVLDPPPVATANSDSHSLPRPAGYPVNVIRTDTTLGALDADALVDLVRAGTSAGSLGVFVWAEACDLAASACDTDAAFVAPSRESPLAATGPSVRLRVVVRAAPWVPIDEVRIRAGGEVVETIALTSPTDPYDQTDAGVVRHDATVDVDLGAAAEDTFITVEAGFALAFDAMGELALEPAPEPFATVTAGRHPHGFTNPIYVDRSPE